MTSRAPVPAEATPGPWGKPRAAWLLMLPVWLYRVLISPWKPPTCRFRPTCSHYAFDALRRHGPWRGTWLTLHRLGRCQPFGEPGFDPVPPEPTPLTAPPATDRSPTH